MPRIAKAEKALNQVEETIQATLKSEGRLRHSDSEIQVLLSAVRELITEIKSLRAR